MPFGLWNAAQTFQRFMDHSVSATYCYINDVLVASSSPEQHLQDFCTVFKWLSSYGIVVNPNKCLLEDPALDFLGHCLDRHGITSLSEKVQVVCDFLNLIPNTNFVDLSDWLTFSCPHQS